MNNSDSEELLLTPPDIVAEANNVCASLVPAKSTERYYSCYNKYMKWHKEQKATSHSQNVLLAYFAYIKTNLKPSSLWSTYSILRTMINLKHEVNIASYTNLKAFLKRQSDGYHAKKSLSLSTAQIKTFLKYAPDDKYLLTKVKCLFITFYLLTFLFCIV